MRNIINSFPILLILILLINPAYEANSQPGVNIGVSQMSRPFAEVTDPELIDFFIDQYMIPEMDVTKIEIIDITNNGFGPDDILVAYPSMNAYVVHAPPEAQEIMRGWSIETEYRLDSENLRAEVFDPIEPDTVFVYDQAERAIVGDIIRALDRTYRDLPIRLRFERDREGFTFQMWEYNEFALSYSPPPAPVPEYVDVHDLLYVIRTDSTIVADTAYYDIFYVIKTVEDIHYIPDVPEIDVPRAARGYPGEAFRERDILDERSVRDE